jgi:hypothetical protein
MAYRAGLLAEATGVPNAHTSGNARLIASTVGKYKDFNPKRKSAYRITKAL